MSALSESTAESSLLSSLSRSWIVSSTVSGAVFGIGAIVVSVKLCRVRVLLAFKVWVLVTVRAHAGWLIGTVPTLQYLRHYGPAVSA